MDNRDLRRRLAYDAGIEAARRDTTPSHAPVLDNLTRRMLLRWVLDGDTVMVEEFTLGVHTFFARTGRPPMVGIAERLTGATLTDGVVTTDCPVYSASLYGLTDAEMRELVAQLFQLVDSVTPPQEFLDALPAMLEAVSDMPYRWSGPEGSTTDASGSMLIPARAFG